MLKMIKVHLDPCFPILDSFISLSPHCTKSSPFLKKFSMHSLLLHHNLVTFLDVFLSGPGFLNIFAFWSKSIWVKSLSEISILSCFYHHWVMGEACGWRGPWDLIPLSRTILRKSVTRNGISECPGQRRLVTWGCLSETIYRCEVQGTET